MVGRRFSRLTVIADAGRVGNHQRQGWRVRCRCGTEKVVTQNSLVSGGTRSCGCLQREASVRNAKVATAANVKHGHTSRAGNSPEYRSWGNMKSRCYNPRAARYESYGGRGIRVCKRWLHSFENFLADMGPKPSPDYSLDRINPNGNYTPSNCRWATGKQQQRNLRRNERLTAFGRTQTIDDWADETGISKAMIRGRIKLGWPPEKILTAPGKRRPIRLTMDGRTQTVSHWAREYGIPIPTLHWRLKRGMSLRDALAK